MPIYEYACDKCDNEWEVEQRITDDPIKTCPKCRSRKVKKLISQTSFVLKGGGWYSDLYSSKKEGKDEKGTTEKTDAKSSEGASEGGGDTDKSEKKDKPKSKGKGKPKAAA